VSGDGIAHVPHAASAKTLELSGVPQAALSALPQRGLGHYARSQTIETVRAGPAMAGDSKLDASLTRRQKFPFSSSGRSNNRTPLALRCGVSSDHCTGNQAVVHWVFFVFSFGS